MARTDHRQGRDLLASQRSEGSQGPGGEGGARQPSAGDAAGVGGPAEADRLEHRVRTRLTVARGWLDLVLGGRLEDPEQVTRALRTVHRQLGILEELLREGRAAPAEGAGGPAEGRTVDLLDAVEATLAEYPWTSSPSGARPRVVGRSRSLPVEPSAMHDALLHLLDNAVEHTPTGTPVEVVLDYRSDGVELAVEDAGPGFPDSWSPQASAGTGLRVVAQLAARLGASVRLGTSRRLGGAAVRLFWEETTIVLDL